MCKLTTEITTQRVNTTQIQNHVKNIKQANISTSDCNNTYGIIITN